VSDTIKTTLSRRLVQQPSRLNTVIEPIGPMEPKSSSQKSVAVTLPVCAMPPAVLVPATMELIALAAPKLVVFPLKVED